MKPIVFAILAFALPAVAAAESKIIDCATQPETSISDNKGTFTFKGACKMIAVEGNENTVSIEQVETLTLPGNRNTAQATKADAVAVPGNENTVQVGTTSAISAAGNKNTVGWKSAGKKAKPKISNTGNKNKIAKVK